MWLKITQTTKNEQNTNNINCYCYIQRW